MLEQSCGHVPAETAASYLLFFSFCCRKIVAEYEKTIAQMIGEVPVLRGRAVLSVLSLHPCLFPSQRMSRGQI